MTAQRTVTLSIHPALPNPDCFSTVSALSSAKYRSLVISVYNLQNIRPMSSDTLLVKSSCTNIPFFYAAICNKIIPRYVHKSYSSGFTSKIEKVPRGIQGEKSRKDTTSSGKLVSTIEIINPE